MRPVKLVFSSEDFIHSLFIPAFRIRVFSERQIARITAQWIFCLGASSLSLYLSGSTRNPMTLETP